MPLSDTASLVLSKAAQHDARLVVAPKSLPAAARNAVFKSLLKNNLVTEINAPREYVGLGWRQDDEGTWVVLRITDEGMRAIGVDPNEDDAPAGQGKPADPFDDDAEADAAEQKDRQDAYTDASFGAELAAPVARGRGGVLAAGQRVLAAWDAASLSTTDRDLDDAIAALRAALAPTAKAPRAAPAAGTPRAPREGTKQEAVLALLRRPEGASGPAMQEATGWAPHTVRGFLAGLKKKGMQVEVLSKERMVGPNRTGAKGSFSVYRVV